MHSISLLVAPIVSHVCWAHHNLTWQQPPRITLLPKVEPILNFLIIPGLQAFVAHS